VENKTKEEASEMMYHMADALRRELCKASNKVYLAMFPTHISRRHKFRWLADAAELERPIPCWLRRELQKELNELVDKHGPYEIGLAMEGA